MNPYYDPTKPHHAPSGFRNLDPSVKLPLPAAAFFRWRRERAGLRIPGPRVDLSPVAPELDFVRTNRQHFAVTWIGHATVLVQIGGLNVLTDPLFSARASPLRWAGPRRWQPPGIPARQLPRIDVVLISHNHYDHLDRDSVMTLQRQTGGAPRFVVPLGLERWLESVGIGGATALDWWDTFDVGAVRVHLVPAQHWSRRTYSDTMRTLWGGFVLEAGRGRQRRSVFFAGDTGYNAAQFRQIGARLGPIDVALTPIGAYEPRWFMGQQHVNPDDAVRMHRDLRARRSIGIHWGTFALTDEPLDQPLHDLAAARHRHGLPDAEFITLRHGQTLRIDEE